MTTQNGATGSIAVIGASGFIGSHLMDALARRGVARLGVVRTAQPERQYEQRVVSDFRDADLLGKALDGASSIVHLADEASRHASDDTPSISSAVAASAAERRVVFTSSIYARLDEEGQPNAYGARKRAQERLLLENTNSLVLRLPPVYGAGCGGSFAMLEKAVGMGIPLPFARADALRSYLAVENLSELITSALTSTDEAWSNARGRIFEPSDAERISTRDLAGVMANNAGRRARLFPVPRTLLTILAKSVGKGALISGAFDALESRGNDELRDIFGWKPTEALRRES